MSQSYLSGGLTCLQVRAKVIKDDTILFRVTRERSTNGLASPSYTALYLKPFFRPFGSLTPTFPRPQPPSVLNTFRINGPHGRATYFSSLFPLIFNRIKFRSVFPSRLRLGSSAHPVPVFVAKDLCQCHYFLMNNVCRLGVRWRRRTRNLSAPLESMAARIDAGGERQRWRVTAPMGATVLLSDSIKAEIGEIKFRENVIRPIKERRTKSTLGAHETFPQQTFPRGFFSREIRLRNSEEAPPKYVKVVLRSDKFA